MNTTSYANLAQLSAPQPFPNNDASSTSIGSSNQVQNAAHLNGFSLYPEKNFQLANEQVPNTSNLADKITNVVDAQIENEVKSENSTHVLNNLITSLAGCAVPTKITDPTTVDSVHAGAEAGVTAARTFAKAKSAPSPKRGAALGGLVGEVPRPPAGLLLVPPCPP